MSAPESRVRHSLLDGREGQRRRAEVVAFARLVESAAKTHSRPRPLLARAAVQVSQTIADVLAHDEMRRTEAHASDSQRA